MAKKIDEAEAALLERLLEVRKAAEPPVQYMKLDMDERAVAQRLQKRYMIHIRIGELYIGRKGEEALKAVTS